VLLERFATELGQAGAPRAAHGDRAVEGAAATLAALGRGQVETLLLTGLFLDDERTAWFGPAPTDVAADRDELAGLGVAEPVEGRLVDVAVRAAMGTGAGVRILDPADQARPALEDRDPGREGTRALASGDRGPGGTAAGSAGHAPAEGLGALLRFAVGV
jgi:hypothetical protein